MLQFGEPITYQPKSGLPFTLEQAVFDEAYQSLDVETEASISSSSPQLGVDLAKFPAELLVPSPKALIGDRLVRQGQTFRVVDVEEDGQGGAELILHRV